MKYAGHIIPSLNSSLLSLIWLPRWLSHKESACQAGGASSIPELGRSPPKGKAPHFSILAWKIPWPEELTGYGPWDAKEPDTI